MLKSATAKGSLNFGVRANSLFTGFVLKRSVLTGIRRRDPIIAETKPIITRGLKLSSPVGNIVVDRQIIFSKSTTIPKLTTNISFPPLPPDIIVGIAREIAPKPSPSSKNPIINDTSEGIITINSKPIMVKDEKR
jgi:hypothetical protein